MFNLTTFVHLFVPAVNRNIILSSPGGRASNERSSTINACAQIHVALSIEFSAHYLHSLC